MTRCLIIVVSVLHIIALIQATGHYSVIGPGTIRSNSKYNVAVSVHKAESPSKIKVGITGPSFNATKDVEVAPMSTVNVEFDVPKLSSGDYNLTASGTEGVIFTNSTKLNYADPKPSIFIQTDKATYKPGDLVQFRVLVLDENTRPAIIEKSLTILINDGEQNRIKQLTDVQLTKGVYTGELQLSEQPVLGKWNIEVNADGEGTETKSFEVAKYVLPKFEVIVESPKDVPIQDGVIKATVRAKYTYGKPVKGKATISLQPSYGSYWAMDDSNLNQEKTIDVDGKGHVEFDIGSKDSQGRYTPPMKLFAVVTEELTGNKQNGSATVTLHSQRYILESVDKPDHYTPGKPFVYKVLVKNVDGNPVKNTQEKKVKLTLEPPHRYYGIISQLSEAIPKETKNYTEWEATVDEHGIASFDITLPEGEDRYFSAKATFADVTSYLGSLSKFQPSIDTPELLKIEQTSKGLKWGKDVSFDVKSSEVLPYFVYTIVARGNIQKTEHVEVPDGRKTHTIKFTPTFEMIPEATIYIHYVFNNELRFQEKTLNFGNQFENSIDISAPVQAKPSEDIKLNVKTDPDSFVGLLGVDQSVLLLKSGNDLDKTSIFSSLNKYKSSTPWQRGYGTYPGQVSGLVTLTNANYPYNTEPLVLAEPDGLYFEDVQEEYAAELDSIVDESAVHSDDDDSSTSDSEISQIQIIRKNFAELWIWQSIPSSRPMMRFPDFSPDIIGIPGPMPLAFAQAGTAGASFNAFPAPPPMASRFPSQPSSVPQIRKEFLETWIFSKNITTDGDEFTLSKKIPDTITSWVVTGFSLNPKTGIALTENPSKIRVFQPFFVSTNLPYSVKRGEVIAIPVIIFNYMDKSLDTEITMDNSDKEYEFTEATNEVEEKPIDEIKRVKRIAIPSNSGKSVSFMIRPKKVGSITLKITATSPLAGDTIHQKLKVEPEGITQYENKAVFLNLDEKQEVKDTLDVNIPSEAVSDSEYIEFSVVGDLLGPTISNLDNLVRMPYGCGEQNMVNFVPNILVVKYLEVTNRKMPRVVEKATKFLEIGYQRELTYKHDDGSYSAFGKSDKSGSTWLTAYVMRSFHQAAKYTNVDPKVITEGLDFLVSKQKENGEFPEVGKLFDNSNQNALALTSFVLLAFFENDDRIAKYQNAIDKAVMYVANEVDKTDDQYSLAIAANALQLAKHPKAEKVLAHLNSVAKRETDRQWWSKEVKDEKETIRWRPRSNDVEITAYVLMSLLEVESPEKSLPIIKWLIAQRNSNGGFASTQDTVIGLQALTKFAYKTGSGSGSVDIDFVSTGNGTDADLDVNRDTIKVNPENSLLLQTHVLPKTTRQVNFTAKGKGSAMVQLSYRYNLADKDKKPSFKVTPKVKENTPPQQLIVEVCAEFVPLEGSDKSKDSNMAVMEIALPSGYVGDTESFGNIESVDRVKRVETKNSDSTVIVYFDSLTPGDVKCLPVEASKAHAVAKQKPASVSIYDYYDTERRATEYYQVQTSLCDICEGDDCGAGCKKAL